MKPTDEFDDVPFVNEECGDTMWDETVLNQLTSPVEQQPPLPPLTLETDRQKAKLDEDA